MATTDIAIQDDALTPEILERHIETILLGVPEYPALVDPEFVGFLQRAENLTVSSDEDKTKAAAGGQLIAKHKKQIDAHYKPWTQAADMLHTAIVARRKVAMATVDPAGSRITNAITAYDQAEARRRAEEMRKAEEEARQNRLEEQRRMEAEAQAEAARKAEEARLARIEMEKAAAAGQAAEAERLRLEAEAKAAEANEAIEQGIAAVQELEAEPIQVTLPPMPAPVKAQGMVTKKTYKGECVDLLALCRAAVENPQAYSQYLSPNEKMINAAVSRQGEAFNCPGVLVREVESTHFRSR